MKKFATTFAVLAFLLLPLARLGAQSVVPLSTFSTSGGSLVNDKVIFSYTAGQVAATKSVGGDGKSMWEGVQQVFCVPVFDTIVESVCQFTEYEFGGKVLTNTDTGYFDDRVDASLYYFKGLTIDGCDSNVWLQLTVRPVSDTDLYEQAEVSYAWAQTGETYRNSGDYRDTVLNMVQCDSVITLHLALMTKFPIPQIFAYQDKALMVNHKADGFENIDYKHYRWYKDGVLIENAPDRDNFMPAKGGALHGCYHVEVPVDDAYPDRWVFSNTICIGVTGIEEAELTPVKLAVYPNPTTHGNTVHVNVEADEVQLQNAKLLVYDIQGRKVEEMVAKASNTIHTNFASGVYSVHVILANGKHEARKLVVR